MDLAAMWAVGGDSPARCPKVVARTWRCFVVFSRNVVFAVALSGRIYTVCYPQGVALG